MSKFPAASKPLARPSNRLPDGNSSVHGCNSSAGLLQLDELDGDEENSLPASLALLLDYIMSKFPATSKPLARPSNRLPDENSSDHGRNSSAGLLQLDEQDGDEENYLPASLALLHYEQVSSRPQAIGPAFHLTIHVFGAAVFVQESSQRSSNISWFDHVQFACASTQSQFEPRFYEGKSLSSIMPSISKVMKVYHSPCQEWGLKVISQRYDLMSSRPSDAKSVPMPVRDAAVLERTLRSALESYNFQLRTMTALFRFSGDSGQIPLELWPAWRQEEENLSSVIWCLPSRRLRSAIGCQILSSSRRFYLRLPLLAQLDMPQGMCSYIKEHNLGLPRRLRRLSGGPPLRLRHPGDALNLRLLLLRRSALKPPLLQSVLRPRRSRPIPRGGFSGVGVCPLFVVL